MYQKHKNESANTLEKNSDYANLKQDTYQASWQCLMGWKAQLLLVTLPNTFPPFSVVPILLVSWNKWWLNAFNLSR